MKARVATDPSATMEARSVMLKIDKAFLDSACENTRSQELIRSIIQVSERLGINIIAEGVETRRS